MSIKKLNEEGRVVQEIGPVSLKSVIKSAGLSSMRQELQVVPGVVQLAGNERVQKAPQEVQAMLFLRAAGYTLEEIGSAFGIQDNAVRMKLKRFDPNDEIKFTRRNRREFQAFKIQRLQTKILDSISDKNLTEADLRDKVAAVSVLQKRSNELMDKLDTAEEEKPVDLSKAILAALPVKGVVKQLPEKAEGAE